MMGAHMNAGMQHANGLTAHDRLELDARHGAEIDILNARFRQEEARAGATAEAPLGQYVVVRCDGVKASKRFLSQVLENARFDQALVSSARSVCIMSRAYAPAWARPYVVGAAILSDEVSFIINRGPNYNNRRIWKMATTLGGALSGAMSVYMERAVRSARESVTEYPQIVSFDARPLVLADVEAVDDYLRWRRLLATNNALAKVLRLSGLCSDTALYESSPKLADDVAELARRVDRARRWSDVRRALSSLRLLMFGRDGWFGDHSIPPVGGSTM